VSGMCEQPIDIRRLAMRLDPRVALLPAFAVFACLLTSAASGQIAVSPIGVPTERAAASNAAASGKYADIQLAPTIVTGDVGDVQINLLPDGAAQFIYEPKGRGPHEWEYKYSDDGELNTEPARQAGVVWTKPPVNDSALAPTPGIDLRSHRPTHIQWQARSNGSNVWVAFHLGGMVWQWQKQLLGWKKVAMPAPDSVPYIPLGVHKLTSDWQSFDVALPEGVDLSHVVNGFACTANWEDNQVTYPAATKFDFQIRDLRYFSSPDAERVQAPSGVVYQDAALPFQMFLAAGKMGDIGDVKTSVVCEENPHSGRTCIKVVYTAQGRGPHQCAYPGPCRWAGARWQYPPSNWGNDAFWRQSGRDLSSYSQLTFWARAENECTIDFVVGGANTSYGDSLKSPITRSFPLLRTWKKYTIQLEGDLSHITNGFGWVTNWTTNPNGAVFFIDDIEFSGSKPGEQRTIGTDSVREPLAFPWRAVSLGFAVGVVGVLGMGICGGMVPAALREYFAAKGPFAGACGLVLVALLALRVLCDGWIPFPGGAFVEHCSYFLSTRVAVYGALITTSVGLAIGGYCGAPRLGTAVLGTAFVLVCAAIGYPMVFSLSWTAAPRAPLVVATIIAQTLNYATTGHSGALGLGSAAFAALTLTKTYSLVVPRIRASYRDWLSRALLIHLHKMRDRMPFDLQLEGARTARALHDRSTSVAPLRWTDSWVVLPFVGWFTLVALHVSRDNRPVWGTDGIAAESVLPTSFAAPAAFNATKMLRYAQSSGLDDWRTEGRKELRRAIQSAEAYRSHVDLARCGKLAVDAGEVEFYHSTIVAAATLDWSKAPTLLEDLLGGGERLGERSGELASLPNTIGAFRAAKSTEGRGFNLAVCAKQCIRQGDSVLATQCLEDAFDSVNTIQVVEERRAAVSVILSIVPESSEDFASAAIRGANRLWFFEDQLEPLMEITRIAQAKGWKETALNAMRAAVNGYRERTLDPNPSGRLLTEWERLSSEIIPLVESLEDAELLASLQSEKVKNKTSTAASGR
jgi:hypothetical protein